MRILHGYITRSFLVTFFITLTVFLFVMVLVNFSRVIDIFSRGVSGLFILRVFLSGIPFALIFAIPMSVLTAVFLTFSRMANDREITAMKSCGVSVWQMIEPPVIWSTLLCGLCIYINCSLAPDSHFARRKLLGKVGLEDPINFLDAGRFINDFPGFKIFIGGKKDRQIRDIIIYELDGTELKRTIRAESGNIEKDPLNGTNIVVNLYQVRLDQQPDGDKPDARKETRYMTAGHYPVNIDVGALMQKDIVWKKRADYTMTELIRALRDARKEMPGMRDEDLGVYRTSLLVEANTRLALSFSCYAFVFLGAALGIRIHRKESSIGMALALAFVFVFYFFVIIADSLVSHPRLYPELIVWIPFFISEIVGFVLLKRSR
ncbi:MAG: LptF/LptG family permease [Lentisphaerae bacterium]|nr:LptF/LptG family permease [Lentisphaerota bacterium]